MFLNAHPSICLPAWSACVSDFPFPEWKLELRWGQWCWEQSCQEVGDPFQFLTGCLHLLSPDCVKSLEWPLPTPPSSLALKPEDAAVLRKEEESNLFFPHFPFGQNNDLQPENHGERESTHIHHSHFHEPRAGRCEAPGCHLRGQKHCQIAPPLQASWSRACSPLPPCRQPRDATPTGGRRLAWHRKWDFHHLVRQGTVLASLPGQLRRKQPPGLKSVIHTGQPKQPPAVILFPLLLNILEKGVPNPSLLGPWHPELNDWSVRQAKACSQGSWPPKTPKKERKKKWLKSSNGTQRYKIMKLTSPSLPFTPSKSISYFLDSFLHIRFGFFLFTKTKGKQTHKNESCSILLFHLFLTW